MNCKSQITRRDTRGADQWYRLKERDQITGYLCAKCYDIYRRLPSFQNFKEKLKRRLCSRCGNKTITTTTKRGYPHQRWYNDGKGGWWCNSCYDKMTRDPIMVRATNLRRMKFKDKIIHVSENPRRGICSLCGRNGKTSIHHIQYHDDDPLKDTIEVCNSCHMKESMKIHGVSSLRWKTPLGGG